MLILRGCHLASGRLIAGAPMLLMLCPLLIAGDSFPINVYPCPKADPPPVLDGKLDAAAWTRLDIELQALVDQLRKTVSEARLTALLNSI